ncbi:MAG: beta-hydroxyacyl-ACP dehydratase [Phycisphaeraceae bacterium]|nr:beta-hydroxyacyl-ACP dehydratase [Phycisphaeraceae bacterium]
MRFELVDQVVECGESRLVARRNVTLAEEYLADHFPGFPVLPGVMMLEAMVQAARKLLAHRGVTGASRAVVTEVRNVKYGNMVRPGQTLTVEVELGKPRDDGYSFTGVGKVADQVAVQGKFTLVPLNEAFPGDRA